MHPHAQALKDVLPIQLIKIGEAPKREISGEYARPLDGIRVLDLSRVLAGPVAGRTLAGQLITGSLLGTYAYSQFHEQLMAPTSS